MKVTQLRRGRAETQTCSSLSESISDLKRSTMDVPPLFSLSKAYIDYVGGLDISLPLLYTKNLVKAFIQLARSYMEVQLALLSWIAYRVGGLCLAPESGVQGCAGSVWNHHLMRADLGHHLPNQPSVTSCRWPEVGHNGSIYVMGNRKTLEIGTALSPPKGLFPAHRCPGLATEELPGAH